MWDRGPRTVEVGIAPHAVGRQHSGQPFEGGGAVVEAGRIGVGQRLVDMQADMSGAPSVIKADVQQMRCQRQLRHDAGLIEKVTCVGEELFLNRQKKALGVSISAPANKAALTCTADVWCQRVRGW